MISDKRNKIYVIISYVCAIICVIALLVCVIIHATDIPDDETVTSPTSSESSVVPDDTPNGHPEVEVPEPEETETYTDKLLKLIVSSSDVYSISPYSEMITIQGKINEEVINVTDTLKDDLEIISNTIMTYLAARIGSGGVLTNEIMADDTLIGYFNTFTNLLYANSIE